MSFDITNINSTHPVTAGTPIFLHRRLSQAAPAASLSITTSTTRQAPELRCLLYSAGGPGLHDIGRRSRRLCNPGGAIRFIRLAEAWERKTKTIVSSTRDKVRKAGFPTTKPRKTLFSILTSNT